ncbi:MAG: hypothetical protein NBKEAIPA_02044 [Nitrospirae bacterium]|nr:hypothetical protein [Nitrospirota bacterium]MCE7965025.1 hypothetical protein [Nitrospira sp. NTP2]RIK57706.1 MAG: hypothetical protein DCC63_12900 [Nitrospira sp.]
MPNRATHVPNSREEGYLDQDANAMIFLGCLDSEGDGEAEDVAASTATTWYLNRYKAIGRG